MKVLTGITLFKKIITLRSLLIRGGTNWYKRRIESRDSLRGLSFIDKNNATVVGRGGVILRTSDGGTTWAFQPRNPMADPLSGITFPKGDTSLGTGSHLAPPFVVRKIVP